MFKRFTTSVGPTRSRMAANRFAHAQAIKRERQLTVQRLKDYQALCCHAEKRLKELDEEFAATLANDTFFLDKLRQCFYKNHRRSSHEQD